jgi:hypothetical protein
MRRRQWREAWSDGVTSAISAATIASSGTTTTTVLTVLAQAAAYSSQSANTAEMAEINKLIQNRLTNQIAALEPSSDSSVINALTSQISGLQAQQSSMEKLEAQYGGNANIFPGLQSLLAELQTYAASGNSSAFDTTLSAANVDVGDLKVIAAPAPFQPDLVTNLKENGLGIGNSASYDLSTETGQQAAEAAVSSAQTFIGKIFSITGSNHLIAGDLVTSLTTQIGSLTSVQQQMESDGDAAAQKQIAALTQNAQNQEHLIELSLGSTQTIASMVSKVDNPPQPVTSVFEALQEAVGATPANYSPTNSAPAILSLLT